MTDLGGAHGREVENNFGFTTIYGMVIVSLIVCRDMDATVQFPWLRVQGLVQPGERLRTMMQVQGSGSR
ncbi:hypothetical protein A2U01_0049656, partial [Trifolium medium]|nr:hypothetical protein [Trifolium medium]